MNRYKSAALPLALLYAALVIYASLYPFTGWRDVGVAPWAYLRAPLPQYWTRFDVGANLARTQALLAGEIDCASWGQLMLKFVLAQPAVTATSTDAVKANRVYAAVLMVMASAEYLIQK